MSVASGHTAVMASKRPRLSDGQVWQDLELFPTPPWATRVLLEECIGMRSHKPCGLGCGTASAWEPCAGLGHMSDVLREYFDHVTASDVHVYDNAPGYVQTCDASDPAAVAALAGTGFDWIITNPPFSIGEKMLPIFLQHARVGVALALRLQWLQGKNRYLDIFAQTPPAETLIFTDRVPMREGGYDPKLSTATAYVWFVWRRESYLGPWRVPHGWAPGDQNTWLAARILPPGLDAKYWRTSDLELAARHVPGFVPPSSIKKTGKAQARLDV